MLHTVDNTYSSCELTSPGAAPRAGAVPEREAQGAHEPRGQQAEDGRGALLRRAEAVARHARRQEDGELQLSLLHPQLPR